MYGWDGLGHMAVAYVAYQTLSPQVRQEVTRLVRLNPSYGAWTANVPIADRDLHAFTLAATWPDQIKIRWATCFRWALQRQSTSRRRFAKT